MRREENAEEPQAVELVEFLDKWRNLSQFATGFGLPQSSILSSDWLELVDAD